MSKTTMTVEKLIKGTVEDLGYKLWDVTFQKEGASHYLRIFIDKEEGITIDDCVTVSHAIDPIIDEADPIDVSYCLEVSSPGIERELTKDEHFFAMIGKEVILSLYKPLDGQKEYKGILTSFDGGIEIETEKGKKYFEKKEYSSVKLADFE